MKFVVHLHLMCTDKPIRMCAACRTRRPQGTLLRVVRQSDGSVRVNDDRRRAEGRGVYVCPSLQCVALAERRRALQRALQVEAPGEVYTALRDVITMRDNSVNLTDG